ncbi:hypothetical protein Scep_004923 [Stephania cephalantha]|uniref:Uncharacterized protein n=1 Tax=Stephania cephalantha TaxID=152367 RepID=A0AAP0PXQ7_9MAGN
MISGSSISSSRISPIASHLSPLGFARPIDYHYIKLFIALCLLKSQSQRVRVVEGDDDGDGFGGGGARRVRRMKGAAVRAAVRHVTPRRADGGGESAREVACGAGVKGETTVKGGAGGERTGVRSGGEREVSEERRE